MTTEFHALTVSNVVDETADCRSFELEVPPELESAYRYRAGQHLTFEIPWDGFHIQRCYSISSCPGLGERLRIAVKRVPDGRASNWMNDALVPGSAIRVSVPEGRFVLDPSTRASAPLFFFAGGSGITPVISLIKSALRTTKRSLTLLYANRDRGSVIYADELQRLAVDHPERLIIRHHYDSEAGHVGADTILDLLHHVDVGEFYVCGPAPFMALVERTLAEAGVHEELVYVERFVSPVDPDRQDSTHVVEAELEAPDKFSLWLDGRSRSVPYVRGKTLLECAQAAGLSPAHSCESGFCGSCMAHVNTGKVHMRTREALSDRDIARGVALLCQSVPASRAPLELDADSTSFRTASAVKSSYGKVASRFAAAAVFAFMIAGTLVLRIVQ